MLALLLKNGADINFRDEYGFTPLHAAVLRSDRDTVAWLVQNGADIHLARDSEGIACDLGTVAERSKEILNLVCP